MHVALLLPIGLPGAGEPADPDTDATLLAAAERERARRSTPLSVAAAGTALRRIRDEGAMPSDLPGHADWVRVAWSAPELTSLPTEVVERALAHEAEVLEGIGATPGALWVRGPWGPDLPLVARDAGVEALLFDARAVRGREPGVVHHLDAVIPALAVHAAPRDPSGALVAVGRGDGLLVWSVRDPALLTGLVDAVLDAPGFDLTTPSRFLSDHPVTGRLTVVPPTPDHGPDAEIIRRKLVRLATRLPERPAAEALEHTLDGARVAALGPGASAAAHLAAHEALIAARRVVDRDRRRGDDWGRVRRIDWDADGSLEVQLETPGLSLVVDPEHGGSVTVLDDKERTWAAGFLPGSEPGRLVRYEGGASERAPEVRLEIESAEEAKGEIVLVLAGTADDGALTCTIRVSDRRLRCTYRLARCPDGRLGPELGLAIGGARIRADGAAWQDADRPVALSGHRFRLASDERQVLLGTMIPADCFVRPADGGVVVWPHWATDGTGTFDLEIDLAPSVPQVESTPTSES